jgi:N-acetylglucosamine-6-phosphate deacetylase
MLLTGARVVTPAGVLGSEPVRVVGKKIDGNWLLPGFVDVHCHGGGGGAFDSRDAQEVLRAVAFHRLNGTTKLLASLVSAPPDDLAWSLALLAELTDQGLVLGAHLEGPFLSHARCGAQNPRALSSPDRQVMSRLLKAGRGSVRMVTIAPELPGALDVIRQVVDAGAVAAIGHTDATYAEASAAIDAGARVATHIFNGMRPVHHREPGPVIAALQRPEVYCELIPDRAHVHPAAARHVLAAAGARRVAFVSDAIAAAGMPTGRYQLGGLGVEVDGGVARLLGGGSLAGSTITVGAGLPWAAHELGLAMAEVARVSSGTGADIVGLGGQTGNIEPGSDADLVVCDEGLTVKGVMAAGEWLLKPEPPP